jgi:hypothetical protein
MSMRKTSVAVLVVLSVMLAFVGILARGGESGGVDLRVDAVGQPVLAVAPLDEEVLPGDGCIAETTCLRQWYQALTWRIGPEKALAALDAHSRRNEKLAAACHDTTHAVGEVAAYLRSLSEAMSLGDTNCGSGYYHGVVATTTTTVDPEQLIPVLVAGCSDGAGFSRWECFHGVGHGFVFAAGGDIMRGVEKCLTITTDSDRGACGSGAFMQELADNGQDPSYAEDPYRVCRNVSEQVVAGQCYDMMANIIRIHVKNGAAAEFAVCRTVESQYEVDCYEGLGRARFAGMPFEGPGIEEYCSQAGSETGTTRCYEAAFANTAAYYGDSEEAKSHCPELSTEGLRNRCAEYLTKNPL